MDITIPGIHHVTAITGEAQPNVDFYVGVLGLRMIKQTVNFDVPDTYHFYYGDELGHPGTILTFFAWPGAPRGRRGTGQVGTTSFSVPQDSLNYWSERLSRHNILVGEPKTRFNQQVLSFFAPDGLALELVASAGVEELSAWKAGPVPQEHAIRGFHSVTLMEARHEYTARMLTQILGFKLVESEGNRFRYQTGTEGIGTFVDVLHLPDAARALTAIGTVHHVAFRTPSDEQQLMWREKLTGLNIEVTPVRDREYFHSIYFHEPGGVLFEIATDPPGFTIDEAPEQLGTHLKLPPWLESTRPVLEQTLPPIQIPYVSQRQ